MRRTPARAWGLCLAVLSLFLFAGEAAVAQTGGKAKTLGDVERNLDAARKKAEQLKRESETLSRTMRALQREMVTAAAAVRGREAEMLRLQARLSEIMRLEKERLASLKLDEGGLARVLAALARMTRNPPGSLLLQDIRPADAVRGAILLRATVPAIEARAGRLRRDLGELAHARIEANARREELALAARNLDADHARLETLFREKARLKQGADAEQKEAEARAQKLAGEARSLRDLLVGLERKGNSRRAAHLRPPPPKRVSPPAAQSPTAQSSAQPAPQPRAAIRSIADAQGLLPFPVIGQVAGSYGDKLESGLTRKGIVIESRAAAQVIAPFDGRIVFAGPFRGYGRLLIIDHGEGYHSLLAGLARIDVRAGQDVLAGEPVGVMGEPRDRRPGLYVELRRDSQPINPTPWLQAQTNEVSG